MNICTTSIFMENRKHMSKVWPLQRIAYQQTSKSIFDQLSVAEADFPLSGPKYFIKVEILVFKKVRKFMLKNDIKC